MKQGRNNNVLQKEVNMGDGQKKGFEISFDPEKTLLKIRVWGFWDRELAQRFREGCKAKVNEINREGAQWQVLIDLTASCDQLQEIQEIINEGIEFLKTHMKQAILVNNSITHFQMGHLFRTDGLQVSSYFKSEHDALRWLLKERV